MKRTGLGSALRKTRNRKKVKTLSARHSGKNPHPGKIDEDQLMSVVEAEDGEILNEDGTRVERNIDLPILENVTRSKNSVRSLLDIKKGSVDDVVDNLNLRRIIEKKITLVDKDYGYHEIIIQSKENNKNLVNDLKLLNKSHSFNVTEFELELPVRPRWSKEMGKEEYLEMEEVSFSLWRKRIAQIEELYSVTPFEKNVNVWKQLWRVVEKCDVVFQVVDCRNPLLFSSRKLVELAKSYDEGKKVILILNKADFLTSAQRIRWANYFKKVQTEVVFFSAKNETDNIRTKITNKRNKEIIHQHLKTIKPKPVHDDLRYKILSRDDLIAFFKTFKPLSGNQNVVKVGMVGWPNVGKSSVINALCGLKRVGVAPTPGKTKYVQTMFLGDSIELFDSPGLVFPSVVSSKAELLLNGVLSPEKIAGDFIESVKLICERIPRDVLELTYGIKIHSRKKEFGVDVVHESKEGRIRNKVFCGVNDFIESFCSDKGYLTKEFVNVSYASRVILKDYYNGKLLFCHPPPETDEEFMEAEKKQAELVEKRERERLERKKKVEEEKGIALEEEGEEDYDDEEEGEADDDDENENEEEGEIDDDDDEKKDTVVHLEDEEEEFVASDKEKEEKKMMKEMKEKLQEIDAKEKVKTEEEIKEMNKILSFNQDNVAVRGLLEKYNIDMKKLGRRSSKRKKRRGHFKENLVELSNGEKLSSSELVNRKKNEEFKEKKKILDGLSKQEIRQLKRKNLLDDVLGKENVGVKKKRILK